MKTFLEGVALNRSLQAVKIEFEPDDDHWLDVFGDDDVYYPHIEQLFDAIFPLFRFNNNLQVFDLKYKGELDFESCLHNVLSNCIKEAIIASQSLKSIRLECEILWETLTEAIVVKNQLQHLSLTRGYLGEDACTHIKSILSCKQCVLMSLTLANPHAMMLYVLSLDEIINGLSNNHSVKCFGLGLEKSCTAYVINSLRQKQLGTTIEKMKLFGYQTIRFPRLNVFGQQIPNVKSLTIFFGLELDSTTQGADHTFESGHFSSLRELCMTISNDRYLYELSSYISNHSSLKVWEKC